MPDGRAGRRRIPPGAPVALARFFRTSDVMLRMNGFSRVSRTGERRTVLAHKGVYDQGSARGRPSWRRSSPSAPGVRRTLRRDDGLLRVRWPRLPRSALRLPRPTDATRAHLYAAGRRVQPPPPVRAATSRGTPSPSASNLPRVTGATSCSCSSIGRVCTLPGRASPNARTTAKPTPSAMSFRRSTAATPASATPPSVRGLQRACVRSRPGSSPIACTYAGQGYPLGAGFVAGDDLQRMQLHRRRRGLQRAHLQRCLPRTIGYVYEVGDQFPPIDGCPGYCTCTDAGVACPSCVTVDASVETPPRRPPHGRGPRQRRRRLPSDGNAPAGDGGTRLTRGHAGPRRYLQATTNCSRRRRARPPRRPFRTPRYTPSCPSGGPATS